MKIKPILFNAEMVRALLEGRKTQTRRVIKARAKNMQQRGGSWGDYTHERFMQFSPYQKGDLLYVRETWRPIRGYSDWDLRIRYCADNEEVHLSDGELSDRGGADDWRFPKAALTGKGKVPSLHMPRWASRITIEVTGVRAERLQDISEEEAEAEGIKSAELRIKEAAQHGGSFIQNRRHEFKDLWVSIYGTESWNANPYVWVYEFRVIHQNIDTYVKSLKAEALGV